MSSASSCNRVPQMMTNFRNWTTRGWELLPPILNLGASLTRTAAPEHFADGRRRLTLIRPFRALRPAPGRAAEVLAPPYDVLSSAEARARAQDKPWNFLHISKPEIDLDPAIDPYDQAVYAKASENLARMIAAGVVIRDAKPCYYVYRLTWPRLPADRACRSGLARPITTPTVSAGTSTRPWSRRTIASARSKQSTPRPAP